LKNTKTKYTSDQRTPVVLPEMEQLLPPLSAEQFSALESDILANGCYNPVIVNEDITETVIPKTTCWNGFLSSPAIKRFLTG